MHHSNGIDGVISSSVERISQPYGPNGNTNLLMEQQMLNLNSNNHLINSNGAASAAINVTSNENAGVYHHASALGNRKHSDIMYNQSSTLQQQ